MVGSFDDHRAAFKQLMSFTERDAGFAFGPPQNQCTSDGRRPLVGWMGVRSAKRVQPSLATGWTSTDDPCLRELEFIDGRLL